MAWESSYLKNITLVTPHPLKSDICGDIWSIKVGFTNFLGLSLHDFLDGSWFDPNKICTFLLHLGNKSIITNDQEAWIYYLFKEVRFHTIIFATSGKHPRLIAENYFKLDFNSQLVLNAATVVREDEIFFRSPCVDVLFPFFVRSVKTFLEF